MRERGRGKRGRGRMLSLWQKAHSLPLPSYSSESVEEHKGKKKKTKDPPASQKATSTRGTRKGKHGKRKRPNTEGDEDGGVGGVLEVEPMGEEGGEGEEEEGEENSMSSLGSEVQLSEEENTEIKDSIRQLSLVSFARQPLPLLSCLMNYRACWIICQLREFRVQLIAHMWLDKRSVYDGV